MSNTETLPDHTLQSMLPADTDYSLETLPQSIDQRWGLADRSFDNLQEMKTYLLFREALLPGEIGQKFRNVHHYSPFIYPPLAAYQFSLPMQQRRNRRILRMVGKDLIPDSCISTADNLLYRGEFLEYFAANRGVYEDAMNQFLERGFLDSERAATVLMPDALHKVSTERLTFMAAVYLLERWIQTMIERKDAWKRP